MARYIQNGELQNGFDYSDMLTQVITKSSCKTRIHLRSVLRSLWIIFFVWFSSRKQKQWGVDYHGWCRTNNTKYSYHVIDDVEHKYAYHAKQPGTGACVSLLMDTNKKMYSSPASLNLFSTNFCLICVISVQSIIPIPLDGISFGNCNNEIRKKDFKTRCRSWQYTWPGLENAQRCSQSWGVTCRSQ